MLYFYFYILPFTVCVNIYKIRRLNESTYLVTSFPEWDYEQFSKSPSYVEKQDPYQDIFLNYKTNVEVDNVKANDVDILGLQEEKGNSKISPEFIAKARDNYFRTYYNTSKKLNKTKYLFPYNIFKTDNNKYENWTNIISRYENNNLRMARKLACILLGEIQIYTNNN